jgi:hypothetical protein
MVRGAEVKKKKFILKLFFFSGSFIIIKWRW